MALLTQGITRQRAGDLLGAQAYYEKAIAESPACVDAWNLKGVVLTERGLPNEAVSLFDRAIALAPAFADVHFNKGNALSALGRTDDALRAYAQAVAHRPTFADARLNVGILLEKVGRADQAIAAFRVMTQACPGDYRGFLNLGVCLERRITLEPSSGPDALSALQRALQLAPGDPDVRYALGTLCFRLREHERAIAYVASALEVGTHWPQLRRAEALTKLGEMQRKAGHLVEAVASHRAAVALAPDDAGFRYNLANALRAEGAIDEAKEQYGAVIARHPEFVQAYINLGNVHRDEGETDEAASLFERALARDPKLAAGYANLGALCVNEGWIRTGLLLHDKANALGTNDADSRFDRGVNLLALGRLTEGWQGYEERYETTKEKVRRRSMPPPYWQGQPLDRKSLLVWSEQGLGDEILHAGMMPEILAKTERCVIECSRRMAPVFARSFPGTKIVGLDNNQLVGPPAEYFDYQVSLAGLGRYLRPSFDSFPRHGGYLKADRDKVALHRARYGALASGRKIVGLSWRSSGGRHGAVKSARLMNLAPLLQTPGAMFVNLQYGDCSAEIAEVREKLGIEIFQDVSVDPVADVDGFFAQVAAMNLVITTSSTTAHVAGSQNVPVWVMLPFSKGVLWYWFLGRNDSPWYPSARLIRAASLRSSEEWELDVARRVADQLRAFITS